MADVTKRGQFETFYSFICIVCVLQCNKMKKEKKNHKLTPKTNEEHTHTCKHIRTCTLYAGQWFEYTSFYTCMHAYIPMPYSIYTLPSTDINERTNDKKWIERKTRSKIALYNVNIIITGTVHNYRHKKYWILLMSIPQHVFRNHRWDRECN